MGVASYVRVWAWGQGAAFAALSVLAFGRGWLGGNRRLDGREGFVKEAFGGNAAQIASFWNGDASGSQASLRLMLKMLC